MPKKRSWCQKGDLGHLDTTKKKSRFPKKDAPAHQAARATTCLLRRALRRVLETGFEKVLRSHEAVIGGPLNGFLGHFLCFYYFRFFFFIFWCLWYVLGCCVCQNTSLPRPHSYQRRCAKLICNIMIWDCLLYNFDAACKTTAFPSNSSKLICVQLPQLSPDCLGDFRSLKWLLEKGQIWDQWKARRSLGCQMRTSCLCHQFSLRKMTSYYFAKCKARVASALSK